ncbi:MAG TPA: choice-of-anchor tandem repeat GloVer-containing protein [Candidatus Sulfotelmatobacter sp.]|nr:choice-of-anchor tandem repeat GloVer-containing protein [Candidatus Sulfotelmatobacter sp.]
MLRTKILCGYLCLALLFSLTLSIPLSAQAYSVLFAFDGTKGAQPTSPLVQGLDGNFYGTTASGGVSFGNSPGGTIFKITPEGTLTTIYEFCSQPNCADGDQPTAGLALGTDGNFYGTTTFGGANREGSVFRITPEGVLTTLFSFSPCIQSCPDGARPITGLVQGRGGNFLGTTSVGGSIFRITPQGALTTLDQLSGRPSGLIQATDGNFYGTTQGGGEVEDTIFRMTTNGTLTTIHTFTPGDDPNGVIQASDGNLYGTTEFGGLGAGNVFKITLNGVYSEIHEFCFSCVEGDRPLAGLTQGTDGNLYGTTGFGGSRSGGTLFRLTTSGTITVLHSFANTNQSEAAPLQATNGNFYGTVTANSPSSVVGFGLIYRESLGLAPFVETVQKVGQVGSTIIILGTNLTGATAVSFNGTAATFTVVSPTEIKAKVPTGATTGQIQVTTPTGVLTSNVAFRVP